MARKRPHSSNEKYLAWLRTQRCACGCLRGPPSDAAHLRAASFKHGKPLTGMQIKPDDKWALPLHHRCHMLQHMHGDELGWWRAHGVDDPFELCIRTYQRFKQEQTK